MPVLADGTGVGLTTAAVVRTQAVVYALVTTGICRYSCCSVWYAILVLQNTSGTILTRHVKATQCCVQNHSYFTMPANEQKQLLAKEDV